MSRPIVFLDIAGPDDSTLREFYRTIFDWPCGEAGSFVPGNLDRLGMHIRRDPKETVFYIGVEDVTATLAVIEDSGGKIDVPRYEVSGVAILGLFLDPAGNRVGLVEMEGDTHKIP